MLHDVRSAPWPRAHIVSPCLLIGLSVFVFFAVVSVTGLELDSSGCLRLPRLFCGRGQQGQRTGVQRRLTNLSSKPRFLYDVERAMSIFHSTDENIRPEDKPGQDLVLLFLLFFVLQPSHDRRRHVSIPAHAQRGHAPSSDAGSAPGRSRRWRTR